MGYPFSKILVVLGSTNVIQKNWASMNSDDSFELEASNLTHPPLPGRKTIL